MKILDSRLDPLALIADRCGPVDQEAALVELRLPIRGDGNGQALEGGGIDSGVNERGIEVVLIRTRTPNVGFWRGEEFQRGSDFSWTALAVGVDERPGGGIGGGHYGN